MKTVKAFTRRNVLTAGTIAIGSSLLPKSLALPERPVQKDTLTPAVISVLTRVHVAAKSGQVTPSDMGEVSGALNILFLSWELNGTLADLQKHMTTQAVSDFTMTEALKSQMVAVANKAGGKMEETDLSRLDNMYLDKSLLSADVNTNLAAVLNGFAAASKIFPVDIVERTWTDPRTLEARVKRAFYMPYEYCRALNNATAAAGLTAGISVFFNPGVAAIFGLIAGITAAATALGGC